MLSAPMRKPLPGSDRRRGPAMRILGLLLMLGLMLAPLGMTAAPAAARTGAVMAAMSYHQSASPDAHPCAEKRKPADRKAPGDCCAVACTFIAPLAGQMEAHALPAGIHPPLAPVRATGGLKPEAEPPPPRFS